MDSLEHDLTNLLSVISVAQINWQDHVNVRKSFERVAEAARKACQPAPKIEHEVKPVEEPNG